MRRLSACCHKPVAAAFVRKCQICISFNATACRFVVQCLNVETLHVCFVSVFHKGTAGRYFCLKKSPCNHTNLWQTVLVSAVVQKGTNCNPSICVFPVSLQEMWDQEKDHLKKFNELLPQYRVRPTALMPFWNVAGFALGSY